MKHDDPIVVETYPNRQEADLAITALQAAGIEGFVQADDIGGMRPHVAWATGGFKVLVRAEDIEKASEVLHEQARIE